MSSYRADIARLHRLGYRGAGVRIGCLDTGVDGGHPALNGSVERFRVFDVDGFDSREGEPSDSSWHGTHIAGLIVGGRRGDDIVGVAPEARLTLGAVIEEGYILSRILLGLDWLAGCNVSIVNLSLGVPGDTPVFRTLVQVLTDSDVLITAPIGNRGAGSACVPGAYGEVLSVGSTHDDGRVAKFSGSVNSAATKACEKPDLVAPGLDLVSSVPGNQFEARSGTSMSSAVVAGMAALLRQAFPRASAGSIVEALCRSCAPIAPVQSLRARHGAVRLLEAFDLLRREPDRQMRRDFSPKHFPKYIDPRLIEKLSYSRGDGLIDAILEFADVDACRLFASGLRNDSSSDPRDNCRILTLRHAPICVARCSKQLVSRVLDSPLLRVASACDVDRSSLFG